MNGLEYAGSSAYSGRGHGADGAAYHAGFVGENIAEHIGAQQHIKLARIMHKLHGGVVHIHVRKRNIGIILGYGFHAAAPQL